MTPTTQTGSMINQAQFDKVRYYVDLGQQEGSRLVTGGEHNTTETWGAGSSSSRPSSPTSIPTRGSRRRRSSAR